MGLWYDRITGRSYGSEAELEAAIEERQEGLKLLAGIDERLRPGVEARARADKEAWGEIAPNRCVLLSRQASLLVNPASKTHSGQIQLDGLVIAIEGRLAHVLFHWLSEDRHQPLLHTSAWVGREQLEPLGHGFTWWRIGNLRKSAIERSVRHDRQDQWRPRAESYWEPLE